MHQSNPQGTHTIVPLPLRSSDLEGLWCLVTQESESWRNIAPPSLDTWLSTRGLRTVEPFLQLLALATQTAGETAMRGLRSRALGMWVAASDCVLSHIHSAVEIATAQHPTWFPRSPVLVTLVL